MTQNVVRLLAVINYSERVQREQQRDKVPRAESKGNQAQASRALSKSGITQDVLNCSNNSLWPYV